MSQLPKFKPTKWKIPYCEECKIALDSSWERRRCESKKHNIIERDNIPFFVPDMKIHGFGSKGWVEVRSDILNDQFYISPTKLEHIILEYGIEKGGELNGRWWIWAKVGGSFTIAQIG